MGNLRVGHTATLLALHARFLYLCLVFVRQRSFLCAFSEGASYIYMSWCSWCVIVLLVRHGADGASCLDVQRQCSVNATSMQREGTLNPAPVCQDRQTQARHCTRGQHKLEQDTTREDIHQKPCLLCDTTRHSGQLVCALVP